MKNNTQTRDAKRIIHELHNLLRVLKAHELPLVAKGLSGEFNVHQKTMLKAMARYIRLRHAK